MKVDSHVMSAIAFFFDLCHPALANANGKGEHNHLLPSDANADADVTCE